jgi:cytochrome c biogenesis protein
VTSAHTGIQPRWRFFASLKLTIPLLLLLAALSVIGTLIPQNATESEYLRLYSKDTYYLVRGLGLTDMYHSWWFVAVLGLLAVNLIACSVRRLPGLWRQVRTTHSGYARLGVYVTHLSVLLLLAAGVIGALWGFKGYVSIETGATVSSVILRGAEPREVPLDFSIRCDDFTVEFYPDGMPKAYVSTLTFLEGNEVTMDKVTVRVNHPVTYRGLTFYQASYGVSDRGTTVSVAIEGSHKDHLPVVVELTRGHTMLIPHTTDRIGFMRYVERIQGGGEAVMMVFFPDNAAPQPFWLVRSPSGVSQERVGGYTFSLRDIDVRYFTGLQVSRDPGVPLFWAGGVLLACGVVGTFTLRRPPRRKNSQDQEA